MFSTGLLAFIFGFFSAWVLSVYKFRGSKYLSYFLVLPLAFPSYIVAFVYADILGLNGSFWIYISSLTNIPLKDLYMFDIMSIFGAILILSSILYPYIYIITYSALNFGFGSIMDSCRNMGFSLNRILFKVTIPVLRPSIVAGFFLVIMEAGSDYALVDYYGIDTFVTGIFRTWFGQNDLVSASKMAGILMFIIMTLLLVEKYQRIKLNYSINTKVVRAIRKENKKGIKAFLLFGFCFLPFFLGFLLPFFQILYWAFISLEFFDFNLIKLSLNTFYLAFIATIIIIVFAIYILFMQRIKFKNFLNVPISLLKSSYAIPGAVIAIGVLIFSSFLDKMFIDIGFMDKIFLSGSLIALIYAYCIRFLGIALSSFESSYSKISISYDELCKTMAKSNLTIFFKVHLNLLKPSIIFTFLIIFVEVLKELPLTLLLRPFNFDTLAIRVLEMNHQEMLIESSVPSLVIVLFSLIPVIILTKRLS